MKSLFKWTAIFTVAVMAIAVGAPHAAQVGTSLPSLHDLAPFITVIGATLGANVVTLSDLAKRSEPGGGAISTIVEMLEQTNPILEDMHYEEGNLVTGHRSTIRTGLPAVYWRLINQGTPPSKSTTAQAEDTLGMLEAWSEVDVELAKLAGDLGAFRLSESRAFIEAMNQEMAQTLFYGNAGTAPEEFTGLAPRYSSLSALNAQNIVSGGGSGADNTSIWLIQWGPNTVHGIVPKGSQAGLVRQDFGEVTVEVTAGIAGNRMRALQEHYIWKNGLVLRDWRGVVRIPNIDVSNLIAESSNADLLKLMAKAMHRLVNPGAGRAVFYMNRTVAEFLDIQSKAAVSVGSGITYENVQGRTIGSFRGIPVRVTDAILETEAAVT
jgi:hypothetical protein